MSLKAFVSSTYEDLRDHRAAILEGLSKSGIHVDPMESWGASGSEPKQVCLERLDGCQVCILLVAFRRGFVPPGEGLSITQLEYQEALRRKLDVLVYLLDEEAPWPRKFDELDKDPALAEWRKELQEKHVVRFFGQAPDPAMISQDISRWLQERKTSESQAETGNDSHPPLPSALRSNVPSCDPFFIGREQVLADLHRGFEQKAYRLLTIIGPGGIGKTELAKHLANDLSDLFPLRRYVDLTPAVSVDGICSKIAEWFKVPQLPTSKDPVQAIEDILSNTPHMLLVLNNFEQAVEWAMSTVGVWMQNLENVQFLVTSREPLGIPGEHRYQLPPLPVPSKDLDGRALLEGRARNESVSLFVDRARRTDTEFELDEDNVEDVLAICRKLCGDPFNIIAVASTSHQASPAEMLEDLPTLETDLWAGLRWSYQRLAPHVQRALQQICVFRDGFDRRAAEAVVDLGDAPKGEKVRDVLGTLCNHSLLNSRNVMGRKRFCVYNQTVQDFGRHSWGEGHDERNPPSDLARRHADHFLSYVENWKKLIHSEQCKSALDHLALEEENILAAHQWYLRHGLADCAARIILGFVPSLFVRGQARASILSLAQTLDAIQKEHPDYRVPLLVALAEANWSVGRWADANAQTEEAVRIVQESPESGHHIDALSWHARMQSSHGDRRKIPPLLNQGLELARERGDERRQALILTQLGNYADGTHPIEEVFAYFDEAARLAQIIDSPMDRAKIVNSIGLVLWHTGRPGEALEKLREAELIHRGLGRWLWVAGHLTNCGLALVDLGRYDEAMDCCREAEGLHQSVGNRAWANVNLGAIGRIHWKRGEAALAVECLRESEQDAHDRGWVLDEAFHANYRGRALIDLRRFDEAEQALRRAKELQEQGQENRSYRYFGALVNLAWAVSQQGNEDSEDVKNCITLAGQLKKDLRSEEQVESLEIQEDLAKFAKLATMCQESQ